MIQLTVEQINQILAALRLLPNESHTYPLMMGIRETAEQQLREQEEQRTKELEKQEPKDQPKEAQDGLQGE